MRALKLPVPRQQFVEPAGELLGDADENVGEQGLWIDIVEPSALHGIILGLVIILLWPRVVY